MEKSCSLVRKAENSSTFQRIQIELDEIRGMTIVESDGCEMAGNVLNWFVERWK
jgi:hypothetical protein